MRDGVATGGGALERRAIADIAVDGGAGQPAAARGPREHDHIVAACRQRLHDGAAEVARAARHQHFHGVRRRQYSSRSSSVCSSGISAAHPSSPRSRPGSPSSSGVSLGR